MMLWLELAWRNILANGRRSLFVGGTVVVSVMALALFAGYLKATRLGIEYATVHGGTGHFQISGEGGFDRYSDRPLAFGLTPQMRSRIEKAADAAPDVLRTVPRLSFSGLLSNGPRTLSVGVSALDPNAESAAFGSRQQLVAGHSLEENSPEDATVIGVELAKRLGVKVGDYVTLLTTTVNGSINAQDLHVVGLASTGSPQADLYLVQLKLATGQSLIATDRLSGMAVLLNDQGDIATSSRALLRGAPGTEVRTWRQLSPMYDQIVGMYEALFAVFGIFILAITAISIATTMLTSVMERTREIGLLRALGISKNSVRSMFVVEGLVLSALALVVGSIGAFGASHLINALNLNAPPPPGRNVGYPFRIIWDASADMWIWIVVSLLTSAATWIASTRIAKLRVINALGVH